MADKNQFDRDKLKNKEKRKPKDFKDLEELKEKRVYVNTNKEIQVIHPVGENKNEKNME